MKGAVKRIRQGVYALLSFMLPVDTARAEEVLTPELAALFERMQRSEQHHSLRVLGRIAGQEGVTHDLLVAALLHDCGKARVGTNLFERTLVVLVDKFMPERGQAWRKGAAHGLKRGFVVKARHAEWSAEDMASAGASEIAVELARRHQDAISGDGEIERLLRILQAADDDE